jgi:hypothetical protein
LSSQHWITQFAISLTHEIIALQEVLEDEVDCLPGFVLHFEEAHQVYYILEKVERKCNLGIVLDDLFDLSDRVFRGEAVYEKTYRFEEFAFI